MAFEFNSITRLPDLTTGVSSIQTSASAPTGAAEGDLYINTGDYTVYIYYGGTWQSTGIVLTPPAASYLDLEGSTDEVLLESGDLIVLES